MDNPFPVLRWVGLAFVAVWAPTYVIYWSPVDFLYLCNLAVILTLAGLWLGSSLLLSSQAVSTMVIGPLWLLDVVWGVVMDGQHLIGGTEYMWDATRPLWVRMLSLDHLAVPLVTWWGIRKLGYDRRAWACQAGIAALVLVISRIVAPWKNINFAQKELVTYHSWGPAPAHLLLIWGALVLLLYWPAHAVLSRVMPLRRL
jgi:hypothetical protein